MSEEHTSPQPQAVPERDDILEQQHFQHVKDTFLYYHTSSMHQLQRKQASWNRLPDHHKQLCPTVSTRLAETKTCIDRNYEFIQRVVQFSQSMFSNSNLSGGDSNVISTKRISADDTSRVRTTLKQLVRDWSTEGQVERGKCYALIIQELELCFPKSEGRSDIFVVVPGAGLARLMYEIASRGFECQGNEFSMYMLFASNFILNAALERESVTIHPWLNESCNMMGNTDQLRSIRIPDISPSMEEHELNYSMSAGDFLQVYGHETQADCCVMCFFLDTAHNAIEYIEKVYDMLRPGGYWINFGPLLYHFSDILNERSVEFTYHELREIIKTKFTFVREKTGITSTYVGNTKSMMHTVYDCVFFVVQRPLHQ